MKVDTRIGIQYGKFNFPVGTSESYATRLIELLKKRERIRIVYKSGTAKSGYVSISEDQFLILCFDKRSRRGNIMGRNVVRVTKTRKPYEWLWDMERDDPVQYVMET